MEVLKRITWRDYRRNWKHNLLSALSTLLTTFMIAAIFSLGSAYWEGLTKRSVMMNGAAYDVQLPEPSSGQISRARRSSLVKYAGTVLKCAVVSQFQGKTLGKTRLYWCDEEAWEKQFLPAFEFIEGRYPQKEDEIMLSSGALSKMGIKNPEIGMTLKNIQYNSVASEPGDTASGKKDMVLAGIYRDYTGRQDGFVSKTFADATDTKLTDKTEGMLNLSLKNPIYSPKEIVRLGTELDIRDDQIIYADPNMRSDFMKVALGLAVFLAAILTSGYLFIYNVQYISVRRRVQFFGQLKAVGFSSGQVRGCTIRQMLVNLLSGLLGGLCLGTLVTGTLVPTVLRMVNAEGADSSAYLPPAVIGAALFSVLVVIISNARILRLIDRIQPIEAMHYVRVSPAGKKRSRSRGRIVDMARKNIFRDRKQAVIILASLSLSLSAFLVTNVIIDQNSAKKVLDTVHDCDYRILNNRAVDSSDDPIDDRLVDQLMGLDGVKKVERVYSAHAVVPYEKNLSLDSYYKAYYAHPLVEGNYEKSIEEYKKDPENSFYIGMIKGIGEEQLRDIEGELEEKGFSEEDFLKGKTVLVQGLFREMTELNEAVGHGVTFRIQGQKQEYTLPVAADCTACREVGFLAGGSPPAIVVSSRFLKKIDPGVVTELVDITYDSSLDKVLERKIDALVPDAKGVTTSSKLDDYDEMKAMENRLKVLGWFLCLLLGLIAQVNYVNMTASGIENRRGELAVLRSIGMTAGQVRQMLLMEGAGYWLLSLAVAVLAGIPLSRLLAAGMDKYGVPFHIPLLPNLAVFTAMGVCCLLIPVLIYQTAPKLSLTQMIQEEN